MSVRTLCRNVAKALFQTLLTGFVFLSAIPLAGAIEYIENDATRSAVSPAQSVLAAEAVMPVKRGQRLAVKGAVVYNRTTCQTVTSGTWSVDRSPTNGVVSTGIESRPLSNGECPGRNFNYAVIYYTWTSTSPEENTDILSATWRGGSYTQSLTFDFVLETAFPQIYTITFRLFIPANYVTGGPSEICSRSGNTWQLIYKGDERSFGLDGASSRGKQTFSLVADAAGDPDGLIEGSLRTTVGETRSYRQRDTLANGRIDSGDNDSKLNDCLLLHQRGTASSRNMRIQVARTNSKIIQARIFGSLGNPLIPVGFTADWDFLLTLDESRVPARWTIEGRRDTFPAYEIYVNDTLIHRYSPGVPPFSFERILKGLGGLMAAIPKKAGTLD